jgi:hypothetical protein
MRGKGHQEGQNLDMNEQTPYTVAEVAKMLNYSPQFITRLFEHEKGVLIVERKRKSGTIDPSAFREGCMNGSSGNLP